MPHKIRWLAEKRVIYTVFEGRITRDELEQFVSDVEDFIAEGIPLVHLITNSLDMDKVDISIGTLKTIAQAYGLIDQLGWTIDINNNPVLKMFAGISSQFAGARYKTVATFDEAVAFLKQNDETLQDVTWHLDDVTDTVRLTDRKVER